MDSDSMAPYAATLAGGGMCVARFEFDYMAARRDGAGRRPPPSPVNKLTAEYLGAIAAVTRSGKLIIGGKSMGGRIASMIAEQLFREGEVAGLLCFGYPFHPPGSPDKLRTDHLVSLTIPTLICQGERDPFGTREEVGAYTLSSSTEVFWLPDGDHDLKPRKASGFSHADNVAAAAKKAVAWTAGL
jgi:predicted alpha/beta-hydrolase family hydrolase